MKTSWRISKAFVISLLIVGCFAGILASERLDAYNLEDFGYNVLRPPAHLPVVLIIVNYAGQPAIAHDNYYYELLLRDKIAMYYRAMSDSKITIQHAGTINVNLSQTDRTLPAERPFGRMIEEAGRSNFDFASYDANHDGTVTEHELGFLIIDNATENNAANRPTIPACIRTRQNIQICAKLALAGHRSSLLNMAHELSHSLDAIDLYGDYNLSTNLSLMAGSQDIQEFNDMQLFHLDPWHKMALGWHRPTILSLRDPHMNIPLHAKASDTRYNSYILYDPARGNREFFMVEFRTPNQTSASGQTRTIHDTAVPGTGVVIWHVNLGTDLKPRNLSEPPQHVPGVFALGVNLDKLDIHRAGTADECAALCQSKIQCAAFTHYQGKCWLKSRVSPTRPLQGATSGVIPRPQQPTPTVQLERDTDRPGADLSTRVWVSGTETPPLKWTDGSSAGGAKIWVHNFAANASDVRISVGQRLIAQVTPAAATTAQVVPPAVTNERDTDRPGADLLNTPAATAEQCATLCQRDTRCRAFTHYQGRCWLKNNVPATRPLPGATSGIRR